MIESANSQLREALKKKNFLEVSIAQAILESANKKMKTSQEGIELIRKKETPLMTEKGEPWKCCLCRLTKEKSVNWTVISD